MQEPQVQTVCRWNIYISYDLLAILPDLVSLINEMA